MTHTDDLIERVAEAIKARWGEPDNRHDHHYEGDAIAAIAAVRAFDVERGPSASEIEAGVREYDSWSCVQAILEDAAVERARAAEQER